MPVELKGDAHLGREQAADACARFCRGLVDSVAPYVVAVKPQVAFFEALGADGLRVLEDVCAYSRSAGLQVIADGEARRHRLDRARVRGRFPRVAERQRPRSRTR